jgi:hypothetical protein
LSTVTGQDPFVGLGKTCEERLGQQHPEDGVTQELKPLVIAAAGLLLIVEGRVRQGLLEVRTIRKSVTQGLLKLFQSVGIHGANYKPCSLFLATESHPTGSVPAEFS